MKIVDQPISLVNDGRLELFFLGCGSAFAKRNYQTNLLIVKGNDHLLVDCGTTCSTALRDAGLSMPQIGNVYVTHSHADHIGGLEELMLMHRYVTRTRPRIWITRSYQSLLWNRSLRGSAENNERHDGKGLAFKDYFDIKRPKPDPELDRDGHRFSVGSINVRTFRTRHYPDSAATWRDAAHSTGLIIDERVIFSGDTLFDVDMVPTIKPDGQFDAIFHDAQFFPGGIHTSLDELETLPAGIKARTYLMHYGDTWEKERKRITAGGFAGLVEQQRVYQFDAPSGRAGTP